MSGNFVLAMFAAGDAPTGLRKSSSLGVEAVLESSRAVIAATTRSRATRERPKTQHVVGDLLPYTKRSNTYISELNVTLDPIHHSCARKDRNELIGSKEGGSTVRVKCQVSRMVLSFCRVAYIL